MDICIFIEWSLIAHDENWEGEGSYTAQTKWLVLANTSFSHFKQDVTSN